MAKGKNYTKKKKFYQPQAMGKPGSYTFRISKAMADSILSTRKKGDDFKMNPQEFLCNYINDTFGLLRKVDEVTIV